jgi:hypothetical protein
MLNELQVFQKDGRADYFVLETTLFKKTWYGVDLITNKVKKLHVQDLDFSELKKITGRRAEQVISVFENS